LLTYSPSILSLLKVDNLVDLNNVSMEEKKSDESIVARRQRSGWHAGNDT